LDLFQGALAGETATIPHGPDDVVERMEELKSTERDLLRGFGG
jgi:hypothetical protein